MAPTTTSSDDSSWVPAQDGASSEQQESSHLPKVAKPVEDGLVVLKKMSSPPEIPTCDVSSSAWTPLPPPTSEARYAIRLQNQLPAAVMEQQAPKAQLKTAKLVMSEAQAEAKQTHEIHSLLQSQGAVSTGRKQDKRLENKDDFAPCMPDNSPDILRLENIILEEQEKNKRLRAEVDRLRNENIVAETNMRLLRRELERKQQEMDNILLPQLDTAVAMIRDIEQKHQCEREEKEQQVDILAAQLAAALDMIQTEIVRMGIPARDES